MTSAICMAPDSLRPDVRSPVRTRQGSSLNWAMKHFSCAGLWRVRARSTSLPGVTITAGRGTTLLYRPTQSPYEEGVPARVMEGARCQNVKTNQISMRQEMVVIGNAWYFDCCAEHREFSIVRIFDEDKVVGMDTAGKLSLRPKEISELIPAEERNSAQNKLGLGA